MYPKFGQIGIREQVKYEKVPDEMASFEDGRSDHQQASEYSTPHQGLCRTIRLSTVLAIQVVLLTGYTFCFLIIWTIALRKRSSEGNITFSPAQEAVHLEPLEFDGNLIIQNKYSGKPRPALDKAWDDLLQCKTSIKDMKK
ncbi:hypothetical protein ONS95_011565 [Cadophora gregata]|uniref:uncharacterized protein n=1 Tax=Cadophora gregata TaxID=51156 RepID=UPI0026DAD938|nr:uncharacterized protein ONS95_011565 [Cadophora gregata]KAK0120159.1 hypothetical protein ONS95_011565 [Cadophora gregata]